MEGEVRLIENKEDLSSDYHINTFYEVITGILNSLDLDQVAQYQIGFDNEGKSIGVKDIETTKKFLEKAINDLQKVIDKRGIHISPSPSGYITYDLDLEKKTIVVKIRGNIHKPYFFDGTIVLRDGKEKEILKRRDEIFSFIAKSSNYKLLNDPVLIDWKEFMCKVFLPNEISPAEFTRLSKSWRIGSHVTRDELVQIRNLYDFIKSAKWFDTQEDLAAKNALLKVIRGTEKSLNRIDTRTKQPIEMQECFRSFVFSHCNNFDPSSGTPLTTPSTNRFSPPGYYGGYDERKSLIKLLEILFPETDK